MAARLPLCAIISLIILNCFVLLRTKVQCFNIETRKFIFKRDGDNGSYFGFSVAQHYNKETDKYLVLVGAPLGQNLQPGTNHSGALFQCPLTNRTDDCAQVVTDGKRDDFDYDNGLTEDEGDVILNPPGTDEIKDGQWMGVTVKSHNASGRVVVCAHRYIQKQSKEFQHFGLGLCYVLRSNLKVDQDLQFCKGKPMENHHLQYGLCQIGTSLDIIGEGYVVVGSPGPFTWRGTIFSKQISVDFLQSNSDLYMGPLNNEAEPIDKYSYMGMSVTAGQFFKRKRYTYASGAPRSKYNGQVYFLERNGQEEELTINTTLMGYQFGSSFGYEILAIDIDNNGRDELLVSAPFYYENGVGGAVYVYQRLKECGFNCNKPIQVLKGADESRFGFALANLGDINMDGYRDVAIGAPYDGAGGAVYIHLGNARGVGEKASQVIRVAKLATFGYSLSAGLDMDRNGYPDLVVGAYSSNTVVVLKTRPIIDIRIEVESEEIGNVNVTKKGCRGDPGSLHTCFSFHLCAILGKYDGKVWVLRQLEEVLRGSTMPRATINNRKRNLEVRGGERNCNDEVTIYIDEGANVDISTPIKFVVNYTILDDIPHSAILNKTSVKHFQANFQKNCGDDDICNSHLTFTLNTSLPLIETNTFMLNLDHNEFYLNATIVNTGESAYETNLYIEHPEYFSYVKYFTHVRHEKTNQSITCDAKNKTQIECSLGNPFGANKTALLAFRFEITDSKWNYGQFTVTMNTTSTDTANLRQQEVLVKAKKIANILLRGQANPPAVRYGGVIKGESGMRSLREIGPTVEHEYQISNVGQWDVPDVTLQILWPYQVSSASANEPGKWLLYLTGEPMIEPLSECSYSDADAFDPLQLKQVDTDDLVADEGGNSSEAVNLMRNPRRRRSAEQAIETITEKDGGERKAVTMDCEKRTAKCVNITCRIESLKRNSPVSVRIVSRLWNSTLMEDYGEGVQYVVIRSVARYFVKDENTKLQSVDYFVDETKAYPSIIPQETGLNIWVIIFSVVAGLIVLIIVIFILYKLGFFKRNRVTDQTLSGNLIKNSETESLMDINK